MSFDSTVNAALLKRYYSQGFIDNAFSKKASRLLSMLKRDTNGSGDTLNFYVDVDEAPGDSTDFSEAQTGDTSFTGTIGSQFSLSWSRNHWVAQIDGLHLMASRNNPGAFMEAAKYAINKKMALAARKMSLCLFTEGWGELGQITSVSGATFAFSEASNIHRVYPGQRLVFSSALNSAALRSATTLTVSSVNYNGNSVTCSANLSTVGGVDNDYVFNAGDRQNSASPSRRLPPGLPVWIPEQPVTDSSISTLGGVTRSNNTRLYGIEVDGSSQSVQESLIQAAVDCRSIGNAEKLVAVLSPNKYRELMNDLGSQKQYTDVKGFGGVGFKTILVYADGIEMPVVSDKYCNDLNGWVIDPDTFVLSSMGPAPHINMDDGNKLLRAASSDAVEVRIRSIYQFAPKNPAACANINF